MPHDPRGAAGSTGRAGFSGGRSRAAPSQTGKWSPWLPIIHQTRARRRTLTFLAPSSKVAAVIGFFNPSDAPAPGAFSRATRAAGLVFVSGTGAGNDIGGQRGRDGGGADAAGFEELEAILRAAGTSLDRVVQMTLLITDPADYREINAEYVTHFPNGLPARHTARFGVPTMAKVAFACIALAGTAD